MKVTVDLISNTRLGQMVLDRIQQQQDVCHKFSQALILTIYNVMTILYTLDKCTHMTVTSVQCLSLLTQHYTVTCLESFLKEPHTNREKRNFVGCCMYIYGTNMSTQRNCMESYRHD